MKQDSRSKIDPITYEVVKHSIWQTLWEGRSTMEKVSGSVVVTEAKEVLEEPSRSSKVHDRQGSVSN